MKPKFTYSIAYADNHIMVRKAISTFISTIPGFKVHCDVDNGRELIEHLNHNHIPDICIIDVNMPVLNGYDTLSVIKDKWPQIPVLVLTSYNNEYAIMRMILNGANGYLLKNSHPSELEKALRTICNSGFYHSELLSGKLYYAIRNKIMTIPEISEREKQFLSLCCTDLTYVQIADKMKLSIRNVEACRDHLFQKLNVKTRNSLVVYAIKTGIVPVEN